MMHGWMPLIGKCEIMKADCHDEWVTPITNTHIAKLKANAKPIRV
jgi:hypothetical protein